MSETGPHVNTSRIVKGDCLEDTADSEDAESHAREGDFATETERELHTTLEFFVNGNKTKGYAQLQQSINYFDFTIFH